MAAASRDRSDWKWWLALVVAFAAFVGVQHLLSDTPIKRERVKLNQNVPGTAQATRKATMNPGRVVELQTTKGEIDFVLFEQDCPVTTRRIAELVSDGCYANIRFDRVEKGEIIQTSVCKKDVPPIGVEALQGLINTKGAVGMARRDDRNTNTSSFYILLEPWRHLDFDYTVFGRLIRGMDIAMRITTKDSIKSARVRELTPEDKKRFDNVLRIESERKTE